ncbi:lipid-A-disaccharide kinase [Sulfurivirga caldicuralii]|uniref:Tetraacyldisaccharide 4'-kinase n=1 Tax=Sulfurivirga caldicuralii TaxID=364032 RepID=A0A1N6F5Y9_9GAMM|nr:tetraacyldisaccharide 4'-kinase [Sulfurivirga caldicuralii]SIN90687.1 lipid-A-disaccharide kinase [Sulfurivirga caldicuralii]
MSWPSFWLKRDDWRSRVLSPLGWLTCHTAQRRLQHFRNAFIPDFPTAGVVVVGNITVGGSGKTPVLLALSRLLTEQGIAHGIVSRGYGGRAAQYPLHVTADTDPALAGDEPVLLAQATGVPVVVDPRRDRAVWTLLEANPQVRIVLSDDGLQHYRLPRDYEIAVVDARVGLGNGACLPAGPLREPVNRLQQVDAVLVQGEAAFSGVQAQPFTLEPVAFRSLEDGHCVPLDNFSGQSAAALAGIGQPERFFDTLRRLGVQLARTEPLPDHAPAEAIRAALASHDGPWLMTAKDAVKCPKPLANVWALEVEARLADAFRTAFLQRIDQLLEEKYEPTPAGNSGLPAHQDEAGV